MSPQIAPIPPHPEGEAVCPRQSAGRDVALPSLPVDTIAHRYHVEWDPLAPVTPLGQLVFFCQFLSTSGLYAKWIAQCPLR